MANIIGLNKKLFAVVQTKKGLVKMEVKGNSSNYKIPRNMSNHIEESIRRTKRFESK